MPQKKNICNTNNLYNITPNRESFFLFKDRPSRLWNFSARIACFVVISYSKIWAGLLNTYKIHNQERLYKCLYDREEKRGLVTVSNHDSCMDDPLLWGCLKWRNTVQPAKVRWITAAHDICFTKFSHALFFSLGRVVPVIRGDGVYQRSMDFILDKINNGDWTHIFPEGRVNIDKSFIRFKWGVGRLVAEAKKIPVVLPMYHVEGDTVNWTANGIYRRYRINEANEENTY
ncbi:tafazzin-like isoform X3 [Mytilus californianus]|uniref:tafazzin-like isoform X3 n=1 Tax=Mytilus californianus TaxID=6549 RepID=UPI0022486C82|nr:tafazzin-like isoform X3 [Mytilus californianus]